MKRIIVAIAALGLLAAACGDDDGGGNAQSLEEALDGGSTTTGGDDGSFSGAGSDDFCEMAREVDETDPFESSDPDDIQAGFEEANRLIDEVIDRAPDEIRDDFETVAEGFRAFGEILEEHDWDLFAVPEEAAAELEDSRFEEAADRIDRYMEEVCGIDSDTDGADVDLDDAAGDFDGSIPENADDVNAMLAQMLGITEEQAACLNEAGASIDADAEPDLSEFMSMFEDCDIDLMELGQNLGE